MAGLWIGSIYSSSYCSWRYADFMVDQYHAGTVQNVY